MKKYFILTFLLVFGVISSIFYLNYNKSLDQHLNNQYTKLLTSYDLALKLASSKLEHSYSYNFLDHYITKLLKDIHIDNSKVSKKELENILYKQIKKQEYSFDNIVFYDETGEEVYALKSNKRKKYFDEDFLKEISKNHKVLFEEESKNRYNFIVISPLFLNENMKFYVEKSISFHNFIKYFLSFLPYNISILNHENKKRIQINQNSINYFKKIYPHNKNTIYTLKFEQDKKEIDKLKDDFIQKIFYSFIILIIFIYILYSRIKTIDSLKKIEDFIDNSNDELLIISSKNDQVDYVNTTFLNNIKYSKKELLNKNINLFIDKPNLNFYKKSIQKGKSFFNLTLKRKDNTTYDVEVLIRRIDINKKRYMCIIKDISQEKSLNEKIIDQKEFFKTLINSSPNGIFVKNHKHKYIIANNSFAHILGYSDKDELLEKKDEELDLNPKIYSTIRKIEQKAFSLEKAVYNDIQKIKDKFYKIILVPLKNFTYPEKNDMLLGFMTDITSEITQKNELARLNRSLKMEILDEIRERISIDEKFKTIFNNIHNAMFIYNIDNQGLLKDLISKNLAAKEFLENYNYVQSDPNEIFEKLSFKYDENKKIFQPKHIKYITKLEYKEIEYNMEIDAQIIEIEKEYKVIIFIENINEKIKLKKDKLERQLLLANIFKKAKAGISIIDKNGKLTKYNQSAYKILGYKRKEFKIKSFFQIIPKENLEYMKKEHMDLFKIKTEISQEYKLISKNKEIINVIGSSTIIKNVRGESLRLFIFEDITKLKQLEQEQIKNTKILAQQAKMVEMGEMIGAIAHQWRQPLNSINAAAMKLSFSSKLGILKDKDILQKTEFIEKQSLKMSDTINDFMSFFKPSKEKTKFKLIDVYENIYELLFPQLKNRGILISLKAPDTLEVYGYKSEFEHILLNLINNAKDAFTNANSNQIKTIEVFGETSEEKIIIKVIDNAGGISEDILKKIFNPYFTTKDQSKGTGIGLYMTKTIIEKHFNGTIEASNSKYGAVFTIVLKR